MAQPHMVLLNDKRHGSHDYTFEDGSKEKILYDNDNKV